MLGQHTRQFTLIPGSYWHTFTLGRDSVTKDSEHWDTEHSRRTLTCWDNTRGTSPYIYCDTDHSRRTLTCWDNTRGTSPYIYFGGCLHGGPALDLSSLSRSSFIRMDPIRAPICPVLSLVLWLLLSRRKSWTI